LLESPELHKQHSPAGLPLAPLLNHALLELEPSKEQALALLNVCVEQPSPVSGKLAGSAAQRGAKDPGLMAKAQLACEAIATAEALGDRWSRSNPLVEWRGDTWHAHFPENEDARYVTSIDYLKGWAVGQRLNLPLPEHFGWQLAWRSRPVTDSLDQVLAESQTGPFHVSIGLASPQTWKKVQQQRFSLLTGLLVLATLVTGVAFWTAWRAFQRQASLAALQSDFIASVSHELRTPVASIGVLAERLEGSKRTEEQTIQYHQFIARETKRLAALVANILDFSRIEQDRKRYHREAIDLPRLVEETVALMQPWAEERDITLRTEISQDAAKAEPELDALALRQALINLIDNAIKFSPDDQEVTVSLEFADNQLQLAVKDRGVGIEPEEQAQIFDRFYRVEGGLCRETRGAGIGLSVVQHIAAGHDGQVTVESTPGEGATFTMHLPLNS